MNKLFTAIILLFSLQVSAQENYSSIDLYDLEDFSDLEEVFDDSIMSNYKVFFTGENHLYAYVNSEIEFKMLVYLNKNYGVNHFLFEQSPATSYVMNQVVLQHDEESTEYLEERYYYPFFELVENIRDYNDGLADSAKIIVHGIDVERFPAFSIYALYRMTKDLDREGETGIVFESIESLATSGFADASPDQIYNTAEAPLNLLGDELDAWKTFESILDNADDNKEALMTQLDSNAVEFFEILEGVERGHLWYISERAGDLTAPSVRERYMIKQFKTVYAKYPNDKFYGQFGRCHLHADKKAYRCYNHNMQSIASRINTTSDSTLNGKVLTIPVYYSQSSSDKYSIRSLRLRESVLYPDQVELIDLSYLEGDNPLQGFNEDIPYVIVNNYEPRKSENIYSFEYDINIYHLGVYYGYRYFNKFNKLNNELSNLGKTPFTNKFEQYSIAFDYIVLDDIGTHFSYNYFPEVSNGDNISLKGQSFSYGNSFPFGNQFFMLEIGSYFTYGQMKMIESNTNLTPNLIQSDGTNVTVYKNDLFTIDPMMDFRLTLPIVSFNARLGYSFDLSSKYWKLDGKMKDFSKTSFSSPFIQVGASLNIKTKL